MSVRLREAIAEAVSAYAQGEISSLLAHDIAMRESAYEAMEKLDREAHRIADLALEKLEGK